jgi:hypothetical protein
MVLTGSKVQTKIAQQLSLIEKWQSKLSSPHIQLNAVSLFRRDNRYGGRVFGKEKGRKGGRQATDEKHIPFITNGLCLPYSRQRQISKIKRSGPAIFGGRSHDYDPDSSKLCDAKGGIRAQPNSRRATSELFFLVQFDGGRNIRLQVGQTGRMFVWMFA